MKYCTLAAYTYFSCDFLVVLKKLLTYMFIMYSGDVSYLFSGVVHFESLGGPAILNQIVHGIPQSLQKFSKKVEKISPPPFRTFFSNSLFAIIQLFNAT